MLHEHVALGAFLERFGRVRPVSEELVRQYRLTILAPSVPIDLADITDRTVLGSFGITADYSAGTDYERPRRLAERLWRAGFDGIYYAARHDPSLIQRSIALFGQAGDQTIEMAKRFDMEQITIPAELIGQVEEMYGLSVLPEATLFDRDWSFDF